MRFRVAFKSFHFGGSLRHRVALIAVAFLLAAAACSGSTSDQPSTSAEEVGSSTAPQSPPGTTIAPVAAAIERLTVNGSVIEPVDGVYAVEHPVDPGDELTVEALLNISDNPVTELVVVLRDLTEPELTVELPNGLSAVIGFIPGEGWGPMVSADPPESFAGQPIVFPISVVDLNGDPVEVTVEQILGLGDRYTGSEYVTSRPLDKLSYGNGTVTAGSMTPGNFRLRVTASDGTHQTVTEIDVPITWAPGENPWRMRGMSIDFWGPEAWHELDLVPSLITDAFDGGANYIQISPNWHMDSIRSTTVKPCSDLPPPRSCGTETPDQLRTWVEHAHGLDMGVLIKPHIMIGEHDQASGGYDAQMWEIRPAEIDAWFESYTEFILHYAHIAEETGVEAFSVGAELMFTLQYRDKWLDLIAAVKGVYSGDVTYSNVDLWTNGPNIVSFWDHLDYIGLPYYYPGSDSDPQPEVAAMVEFIATTQDRNLQTVLDDNPSPIVALELGGPNFDGTNYDKWDWTDRVVDNQEIVDWVEAAFLSQIAIMERGTVVEGTFAWVFKPNTDDSPIDWDYRGFPLMDAIAIWYSN